MAALKTIVNSAGALRHSPMAVRAPRGNRSAVSFSGLIGSVTVAHIHCCTAAAEAGTAAVATPTPTSPGFPVAVTSGSYDQVSR
jgi:hypothetical protein